MTTHRIRRRIEDLEARQHEQPQGACRAPWWTEEHQRNRDRQFRELEAELAAMEPDTPEWPPDSEAAQHAEEVRQFLENLIERSHSK
jgi:hypothetical protein